MLCYLPTDNDLLGSDTPFLFDTYGVTFSFPYNNRPKQSDHFRLYFNTCAGYYCYYYDNDYSGYDVIVEVDYVYSEYTTGIGSGIDVPRVLLKQLDGTTAEALRYTIDDFDHEVNAISCVSSEYSFFPLDIEVEFSSSQGVLANHTFVILARLYDPVLEEDYPYVQEQLNVTISVGPGN